jgi:hypothetical protein
VADSTSTLSSTKIPDPLHNGVVLVGSTLIAAALFQPLCRRIQRIVDRRFYRSKYDGAKIVTAFSSTLRQEVDLDQLREQLLAVVQETMQPAHVSLWLRKTGQQGSQFRQTKTPFIYQITEPLLM